LWARRWDTNAHADAGDAYANTDTRRKLSAGNYAVNQHDD
jgi:hypothetical protein